MSWLQRFFRNFLQASKAVLNFLRLRYEDWVVNKILLNLIWRWCLGYGERPSRVIVFVIVILLATWICYWQLGSFVLDPHSSRLPLAARLGMPPCTTA